MSQHEKQKHLARSYSNRFAIPYAQALSVLRDKKLGLATLEDILGQTFGDPATLDRFRENLFAHLGLMSGPETPTKLPKEFFFDEVISIFEDFVVDDEGAFLRHQPTVPPLSATVFADAFCSVEAVLGKEGNTRVTEIYMHPKRYMDLRKFGRDILDTSSFAHLRHLGVMGGLWGAAIISSSRVPANRVFICGEGFYTPNTLTEGRGGFDPKKVSVLEVVG